MFAALAGPLIGAVAGGLLNGKKSTQEQQSRPYLPPAFDANFESMRSRADALSQTPFPKPEMLRVEQQGDIFDSPVMLAIQQALDRKNWEAAMNPQAQAAPQAPQMAAGAQNGRNYLQDMINGSAPIMGLLNQGGGNLRTQLPGMLSNASPQALDQWGQFGGLSQQDQINDYFGQGQGLYAKAFNGLLGR